MLLANEYQHRSFRSGRSTPAAVSTNPLDRCSDLPLINAPDRAGFLHSPTKHTPGNPPMTGQQVFNAHTLPEPTPQSASTVHGVNAVQIAFCPQNPPPFASPKQKQLSPQPLNPSLHVGFAGHMEDEQDPLLQMPLVQVLPQVPQFRGSVRRLAVHVGTDGIVHVEVEVVRIVVNVMVVVEDRVVS